MMYERALLCFKVPRLRPFVLLKSGIKMNVNTGHRWIYSDKGKPRYWGKFCKLYIFIMFI